MIPTLLLIYKYQEMLSLSVWSVKAQQWLKHVPQLHTFYTNFLPYLVSIIMTHGNESHGQETMKRTPTIEVVWLLL